MKAVGVTQRGNRSFRLISSVVIAWIKAWTRSSRPVVSALCGTPLTSRRFWNCAEGGRHQ